MFHVEQKKTNIKVVDHFLTKETFVLSKTDIPGMLRTTPPPTEKQIGKYYNSKQYTSHNSSKKNTFSFFYRLLRSLNFRFKFSFLDKKKINANILDFGSGEGYFINKIKPEGFFVFGVDPFLPDLSKNIFNSIYNDSLSVKNFKHITAWHSLEHVHDIDKTVLRFFELLEDHGTAIVAVPNHQSFDAQYYRDKWAAYDVPRHLWHFDKEAIKSFFSSRGFSFISSSPMLLDAYYVSLLSEKNNNSRLKILRAIIIGTFSNVKAFFTKQYSSNVFVFKKTNTNI